MNALFSIAALIVAVVLIRRQPVVEQDQYYILLMLAVYVSAVVSMAIDRLVDRFKVIVNREIGVK